MKLALPLLASASTALAGRLTTIESPIVRFTFAPFRDMSPRNEALFLSLAWIITFTRSFRVRLSLAILRRLDETFLPRCLRDWLFAFPLPLLPADPDRPCAEASGTTNPNARRLNSVSAANVCFNMGFFFWEFMYLPRSIFCLCLNRTFRHR